MMTSWIRRKIYKFRASDGKLKIHRKLILHQDYLFSNLNPKTNPIMIRVLLLLVLLPFLATGQTKTDTIEVHSAAMNKRLKAAVTTPSTYLTQKQNFPVLYLLHGGSGSFSDWHQKVTEPGLVSRMAEEYNLIIVTPSVGPASYYYDSPTMDSVRYETYIIDELIPYIDNTYRTLARKESRAITGLSMGGHGAMMLSAKHPELFVAAGSMSGVMNIDTRLWKVADDFRKIRQDGQKLMLGEDLNHESPSFNPFTAVGLVDKMKANGMALIFDCGVDDFLIETNRQIHQLLLENGTPHEYIERPGAHTWPYWTEALPVHLLFIDKYLKRD
jgi:S-formylglutathione hydrolase FrmB